MISYWFTFQHSDVYPLGTKLGVGVTAENLHEAVNLLVSRVFTDIPMPIISELIERVKIEQLEKSHVLPNIGDIKEKGIWFPLGYNDKAY